jgi:hypothetical protein
VTGRTVRVVQADGLRVTDGRSENESRTSSSAPQIRDGSRPVQGRSASNRCRADGPRRPGGHSAKLLLAKNSWQNGSKQKCSRTREEHLDELHLADSSPATRGRSARHGNNSPSLKPREPNHLSVHGSPKRLELLRKDLGEM